MSEIVEKMNTFTYFDDDNDNKSEESYYKLNYMSFTIFLIHQIIMEESTL